MKKKYLIGVVIGGMAFSCITSAQAGTIWGNNAGTYGVSKFDSVTGTQDLNFYPGGNGRGIVQVGNILYLTQSDSNNIFKADATTGAALGVAFTIDNAYGLQAIAYDGSDFWVGDYSGTNQAYKYSATGTLLKTIELTKATGYYDGLEYFNNKLIANRFDGGLKGTQHYDIYDLDGGLLTADFINTEDHGNGTGIAFDGTDFYVSDIENNRLTIWDGITGDYKGDLALTGNNSYWIEDLSVDYAEREDTGGGNDPVPEPATMLLMGTGLVGLIGARRRKKA